MKSVTGVVLVHRAMVISFCIATLIQPPPTPGCMGTRTPACTINPTACLKSMTLTKGVSAGAYPVPFGGPTMVGPVGFNLFLTCPITNNCGNRCPTVATPTDSELTFALYGPFASIADCPPVGPLPPAVASTTISFMGGTMPLPACTPDGANTEYAATLSVPEGTPPGVYCAVGTAKVTFSDGMMLTASGDTLICLVDAVPGQPAVPRLGMELLTPMFPRVAPGDQAAVRYRIKNNDPTHAVQLNGFASSRQAAVRPQGGNEAQGVFAISSPFGDDFPIQFDAPTQVCITLPDHPYTQPEACKTLTVLGPGQSTEIMVGIRSYGQCASGSCSESTLRVSGSFADGRPALACAGMTLIVDTSLPSLNWGRQVNDCNQNGIPDAVDIATRRSQDRNNNALPDECESFVVIPLATSVQPNNPAPGAPIRVQVAFNENVDLVFVNVWANGAPLIRTQSFGFPIWVGTIPADTRPGPQTVFFLAKGNRGQMSSTIGLYTVQARQPVVFQGFTHLPLGAASLDHTANTLAVGNIGSSGQDGVSVDLTPVRNGGFGMLFSPVNLNNNGAALTLGAAGVLGGRDSYVGQVSLMNTAGVVHVAADYRSTGDPYVLVEVWDRGQFVGGTILPAGRVGTLAAATLAAAKGAGNEGIGGGLFPIGVGKFGPLVFPYCIPIDFLNPFVFTSSDGRNFQGTQLRLLSPTPGNPVGRLTRFYVQGAGLGGMTILNEFVTGLPGLNIARSGSNAVVTWPDTQDVLEATDRLGGPFRTQVGAFSPHVEGVAGGARFFRLRRDTPPPPQAPPGVPTPPVFNRAALDPIPSALPSNATATLPSFDGDPVFVSLPAMQRASLSSEEVFATIIEPVTRAMSFNLGGQGLSMPPQSGVPQARADFNGLAQALSFEYANNPGIMGPQTSNMLAVFLGLAPPNAAIDNALLTGEGMTYTQYVAGIQREEIIYPFRQVVANVPIEHSMLIASRWEGQHITSVYGALLNRFQIVNQVVLASNQVVPAAIAALSRVPGVWCPPNQMPGDAPALVLLPYGTDAAGVYQLHYAYRLVLNASTANDDNAFLLWLDAEQASILRAEALGYDIGASGRVYNRDPGRGTTTSSFQVDGAVAGQYRLQVAGVMNRVDFAGDGYNGTDVSISSTLNGSSATFANFNQAPVNDAAQALCNSGSNKGFVQVNLFATMYRGRQRSVSLGIYTPFPFDWCNLAMGKPWTPQCDIPGYCNANALTMRFGACKGYLDPACPSYTTGTVNSDNYMNFAHDNSVVSHELGHAIMRRFTNLRPPNWCGVGPCQIPAGWIRLHDLADFWADHFESCNCAAGWVGKNQNGVDQGLNCSTYHNEGGGLPRLHQVTVPFNPGSPGDHFPEHRMLSTHAYGDGQIGAAALWQVRLGMRSKCRPSGIPQFEVRYARALKRTGFFVPLSGCDGHSSTCPDNQVYQLLHNLLLKMVDEWATSGSPGAAPAFAHNGPHTTSKVLAGFARAGIFLIPLDRLDGNPAPADNGGTAVIDIDDNTPGDDYVVNGCAHPEVDFLRLGGAAPTFHVWTGPRYRLSGAGGSATYNNPAPCNSRFRVEVSTSSTFVPAQTINGPYFNVDLNPATAASPEGYGTWTPSAAQWTTLQAGGAGTRIYYRARTDNGAPGVNERLSTSIVNGAFLYNVPAPYAVITANGMSDY